MSGSKTTKKWEHLSDEEILGMRVRDFNLQIPGSWLEPLINRLYEELDAKGVGFHPPCYLADEWLCPDKVAIIGIPFYLAHPRLKSIEKKMMYEVEGGTEKGCMKLLRHECGHSLNYAYELYRRTRWRELFGHFSAKYSTSYNYQPYSRRFVINLEDNYAQAHPDEDFAETFAVWLRPGSGWEQKYRDWPVVRKLRYVDSLMRRTGTEAPKNIAKGRPPFSAGRMTSTLASYYQRKRRELGIYFQGYYDDSLKLLFEARQEGRAQVKASEFIRNHRKDLMEQVTRWTGHRKYDICQLVNGLVQRCEVLELYTKDDKAKDIIAVTSLLTAIAGNYLRKFRRGRGR
jgi:hypothetical protein